MKFRKSSNGVIATEISKYKGVFFAEKSIEIQAKNAFFIITCDVCSMKVDMTIPIIARGSYAKIH